MTQGKASFFLAAPNASACLNGTCSGLTKMSKKPKVLQGIRFPVELQKPIDDVFNVVFFDSPTLCTQKKDIVAIIACKYPSRIDDSFLDQYPSLEVIGNHGVGTDRINVPACHSRGIKVGNTPGILSDTTADMAFSLLLASARRICEGDKIARSPSTQSFDMNWFGHEVTGSTLGIVGLGRIGIKIAQRALGFEMKILYNNRRRLDEKVEKELSVKYYACLQEMLLECDFVVLVIPGTEENFKMFSTAEFKAMKKTSVFVNISRGSVVDQEALATALTDGTIAAAGVDVTSPEPLPRDHPLLQISNLTITPHIGTATMRTRKKILQLVIDNILCGLKGESLVCEVTE